MTDGYWRAAIGRLQRGWGLQVEEVVDEGGIKGGIKGGLCHKKRPGRMLRRRVGSKTPTGVSGAMRVRAVEQGSGRWMGEGLRKGRKEAPGCYMGP